MTKSALFAKSSVILTHFCVISRHFWIKLHKKCPFLKIPNAALKFSIILWLYWFSLREWELFRTTYYEIHQHLVFLWWLMLSKTQSDVSHCICQYSWTVTTVTGKVISNTLLVTTKQATNWKVETMRPLLMCVYYMCYLY